MTNSETEHLSTPDTQPKEELALDTKPVREASQGAPATKPNKLEALKKKQEQLKAQIAALEAREKEAERKKDTRRKIIVGGAVLAHAALDPVFAHDLKRILKAAVTRDSDRETISDLLD